MTKRKNAHLVREEAAQPDPRQLELLEVPKHIQLELEKLDAVKAAWAKHFGPKDGGK